MKLCGNTALHCIANLLCLCIIVHRAFLSVKVLRVLSCGLLLTGRNTSSPKCHVVHLCTVFLQLFNSICESFACWASALWRASGRGSSGKQGQGRRAGLCDKRCPLPAVVQRGCGCCGQLPCLRGCDPREGVRGLAHKFFQSCWIPNSVLPLQELFREVTVFPIKGQVTSPLE